MVSFTILLWLCLITELVGILDGDIDISSKLKLMSTQNGGSTFSKKLQSFFKEERWILNKAAYRTGFRPSCRTIWLKLTPRMCKRVCFKRRCYKVCDIIRKICTI